MLNERIALAFGPGQGLLGILDRGLSVEKGGFRRVVRGGGPRVPRREMCAGPAHLPQNWTDEKEKEWTRAIGV